MSTGAHPARILLRSSWQIVNIGDIAHTPGVLALLEQYIPEAEVVLWASGDLSAEVAVMEHKRFPKLKIVKGTIGADGQASNKDLADAVAWPTSSCTGSGSRGTRRRKSEHAKDPCGGAGELADAGGLDSGHGCPVVFGLNTTWDAQRTVARHVWARP